MAPARAASPLPSPKMVSLYKDVDNSASSLQSALDQNPVSVAIQADQSVFQQYTGGVITSGCGSNLDHGVLAVGYDGNTIKVKNSWGSSWGDNGYVSIDASQCGITTSALPNRFGIYGSLSDHQIIFFS